MRAIILGIVATLAATSVWMALEHFTHRDLSWLTLGVGLAAGLSVAPKLGENYSRAVFAVLLTLVACVGGRQAYAVVFIKVTNPSAAVDLASPKKPRDIDNPTVITTQENTSSVVQETQKSTRVKNPLAPKNIPMAKRFSQWDVIWSCLSCLIAYVTGKGRSKAVAQ